MSLLIKGMDMLKPGDIIVVARIDGRVQCTIASRHLPVKWREVVNIPTPHGDLIDRNALLEHSLYLGMFDKYGEGTVVDVVDAVLDQDIENAPTIIETEG